MGKNKNWRDDYAKVLGKTIELARKGLTQNQIAGETDRSLSSIQRICKKFGIKTTGVLKREHLRGKKIMRQLELPFM